MLLLVFVARNLRKASHGISLPSSQLPVATTMPVALEPETTDEEETDEGTDKIGGWNWREDER